MVRIALINPPSQNKNGFPLLSQMYLASSLLELDHEVNLFDLGAKYYEYNIDSIIKNIYSYRPDIIGVTIYTLTARSAYDFIVQLNSNKPEINCLLVAGGPHPTAVPNEPLEHGFDVVVRGEGENALNELAQFRKGTEQLRRIKGISYRSSSGKIHHNQERPFIKELDKLPLPFEAIHLFKPGWYFKNSTYRGTPAGILTSRGCPGKCIFCANIITGRQFRYRSADNILDEMRHYNNLYSTTFFSFWDDCFTSNPKNVRKLCEKLINLKRTDGIQFQWSCNSRVDRFSKTLLEKMKTAGCISITFGIESGSPETLRKIRKGIDLDAVEKILSLCKDVEMITQVNFMVGFPWETKKHLQDTLDYMKRISPLVNAFSTRGVVIPFPGTELYEEYKNQYGFQNWWLERNITSNNDLDLQDQFRTNNEDIISKIYLEDPILDVNFFNYSTNVKKMIKRCLEYKGEQTLKKINDLIKS